MDERTEIARSMSENVKKDILKSFVPSKGSHGYVNSDLTTPTIIFPTKGMKSVSLEIRKGEFATTFPEKLFFFKMFPMDTQNPGLTSRWKVFDQGSKKFCSMSEEFEKISPFSQKKSIFNRMFLWTSDVQFPQPREKFFNKNTETPRSMFEKIEKIIFLCGEFFSSKRSYGQAECSFDNPAKNSTKPLTLFIQCPKKW